MTAMMRMRPIDSRKTSGFPGEHHFDGFLRFLDVGGLVMQNFDGEENSSDHQRRLGSQALSRHVTPTWQPILTPARQYHVQQDGYVNLIRAKMQLSLVCFSIW